MEELENIKNKLAEGETPELVGDLELEMTADGFQPTAESVEKYIDKLYEAIDAQYELGNSQSSMLNSLRDAENENT